MVKELDIALLGGTGDSPIVDTSFNSEKATCFLYFLK
jgi:hypothetical protein